MTAPATSAASPTHAGGLVVRERPDGLPELLVITARRDPAHWVLPKGHVEAGEDPAATAAREVREEAGVTAEVVALLGDVAIDVDGEHQLVRWYLMRHGSQVEEHELRDVAWLDPPVALARLSFPDTREVAERGLAMLAATSDASP